MLNINGKDWSSLKPSDIQDLLLEKDLDESFYFEFKDDDVSPSKVMEEVSAFANTFGGYIFIGVDNNKNIKGCSKWNEQRIHTAIHDSITPTPSFDVKKFTIDNKTIYAIKIDEGSELPYITNKGKIYERLSSGSFTIKDSVRLSQIYNKREQILDKMERKVSIAPVPENVNNVYGYIDIGFSIVTSDIKNTVEIFNKVDLKTIAQKNIEKVNTCNLSRIGESIIFAPGGLSSKYGYLPAHTANFLEIMADGSARMRVLLFNNDENDVSVNMTYADTVFGLYKDVYTDIMGAIFPNKFAYAKKYESLTVNRQFTPVFYYSDDVLELHPDWQEQNDKMLEALQKKRKTMGVDTALTSDRIPKNGLYTIDKRQLETWGMEFTASSILEELFFSRFSLMGFATIENKDEK